MVHEKTEITDLARALLDNRGAIVGQFTMDLFNQANSFADIPRPAQATFEELVVSAAILELFALRRGESPPSWTKQIGGRDQPYYLMGAMKKNILTLSKYGNTNRQNH